nr:hypothetical protein Q903MT_gene2758 [Picea sitchensis]
MASHNLLCILRVLMTSLCPAVETLCDLRSLLYTGLLGKLLKRLVWVLLMLLVLVLALLLDQ